MKTKKKNPQDATLRNVRAAKRQIANLALAVATLTRRLDSLESHIYRTK